MLLNRFGVLTAPVYCTKIASRLVRTYTDRHGLKDLTRDLLDRRHLQAAAVERLGGGDAQPGAGRLCGVGRALPAPAAQAALDERLAREGRAELARACFDFLPQRARLDLAGWGEVDIFAHS